jgi:hypothetical protein
MADATTTLIKLLLLVVGGEYARNKDDGDDDEPAPFPFIIFRSVQYNIASSLSLAAFCEKRRNQKTRVCVSLWLDS